MTIPDNQTTRIDDPFHTTTGTYDHAVTKRLVDACWSVAMFTARPLYQAIDEIIRAVNPDVAPATIESLASAITAVRCLANWQAAWSWADGTGPLIYDSVTQRHGTLIAWHDGSEHPIHLEAHLSYIRTPEGHAWAIPGTQPGILRVGGQDQLRIYTGLLVNQLAIHVAPYLAWSTTLQNATHDTHPWQTRSTTTVIRLVQQLPALCKTSAATMANLVELVANLTTDPEKASTFVKILPIELSTHGTLDLHGTRMTNWCDQGGDPATYATEVIVPALQDNPAIDLIASMLNLHRSITRGLAHLHQATPPSWEEVFSAWSAREERT